MSTLHRLRRRVLAAISPMQRHDLGGVTLVAQPDDKAAERLAKWSPDWKTALIAQLLEARDGLFLDVGANVGQTLVDYASTGRRGGYVGFEPNPRCVDHLQRLINYNGLDFTLVPAGLSNATKAQKLYSIKGSSVDGSATLMSDLRPARTLQSEVIACFRLDDISGDLLGDQSVSLVKIDVEGAELYTLQGMRGFILDKRPWIVCEVLGRAPEAEPVSYAARNDAIMTLMKDLNYVVLRLAKSQGQRVTGFQRVDEFPDVVWTAQTQHDFDYVFAPEQDADQVASAISGARRAADSSSRMV